MTLSDLLQGCLSLIQSWYNKNVTRLTTQGCSNIVISLLQPCRDNLVTSLITSTRLLQFVNSLFQTCWQLVASRANTTCRRLVCRLATSCEIFTSRCVLGLIKKLIQSRFLLRFSFWWMRKSGQLGIFRCGTMHSEHSLLIHLFTSSRRRISPIPCPFSVFVPFGFSLNWSFVLYLYLQNIGGWQF